LLFRVKRGNETVIFRVTHGRYYSHMMGWDGRKWTRGVGSMVTYAVVTASVQTNTCDQKAV
jgi:hypothetical protein